MSDTEKLPEGMIESAKAFANSILAANRGFGFARSVADDKGGRAAVVVFMTDNNPLAPMLHGIIRLACESAEAKGTVMGMNAKNTLDTLLDQ